ncbi:NACHT domain-containing protein [Streptomyces sp. NBC_01794]|uniref:NACHT domain-containing protein n=1 Tax=Streptomyces sp. NBC_01794 TaxID=2975942 RepID=UPI00308575AD|nr:NACHT domain-containing protein [Streptomyces sp. NBC_01794]
MYLANAYHLGVAGTAVSVVMGLGPAFLAWEAFRYDRREAVERPDPQEAVTALADEVRGQWEDEAKIRGLYQPRPLPIAWRAADADLTEDWSLLRASALAWPNGPPGDSADWPSSADGLAGQDQQIGDVFFSRIPTRRLVVLGEPGSGKTMLLVRLLLELIERRTAKDPVPVLFSVATWDPGHWTLTAWMARQLCQSHPWLLAPTRANPATQEVADLAQVLLDGQRILPILDGFDELPAALRVKALNAVSRSLGVRQPVVLSSRAAEYRAARVRLEGAAGIELLPVDPDEAAAFLRRGAGEPLSGTGSRWHPVEAQFGTSSPVGRALSTPLGLFLARTLYSPRPGMGLPDTSSPPAPTELLDVARFSSRQMVDQYLLGGFIPASYGPNTAQAQHVLARLARRLEDHGGGSPDIAWWDLRNLLPPRRAARTVAAVLGVAVFVTSGVATFMTSATPGIGLGANIIYCLGAGALYGLLTTLTVAQASRHLVAVAACAAAFVQYRVIVAGPWSVADVFTAGLTVWLAFPALRRVADRLRSTGPLRSVTLALVGALIGGWAYGVLNYVAYSVAPPAAIPPSTLAGYALRQGTALGLFLGLAYAARVALTESPAGPGGRVVWRWNWSGFLAAFVLGGAMTLLAAWAGQAAPPMISPNSPYADWSAVVLVGVVVALLAGLVGASGFGLTVRRPDLTSAISPRTVLAQDQATSAAMGFTTGIAFMIVFGLAAALITVTGGIDISQAGSITLLCGLLGAAIGALQHTSYILFLAAQRHLAKHEDFPRDLMAFLEDAHQHRGVLRQIGPVYQFRHIDLQRHLAREGDNEPRRSNPATPAPG